MLTKDLLAQFNVVARTEYNREYQGFEPEFKELLFEYESGPVETVNFPFFGFLRGMEEFTGSRKHQTFPDGYKFTVTNKEWDVAVDIPMKDLDRAANVDSVAGLNIYKQRIAEMPMLVKDHPVELAFDMLEAGDASTYGLTFDGQLFFDVDHSYSTVAGTQSNVITNGSGTSVANVITDIMRAIARLDGFTYAQGGTGNAQKRKLNKTLNNLLIVAPTEMGSTFRQALSQDRLATGETNPAKGIAKLITRPMDDATDWYIVVLDSRMFRPFLFQVEKPAVLDMPTPSDESVRERKEVTYGAYGRYNVAYGAWFTAIMIQNT